MTELMHKDPHSDLHHLVDMAKDITYAMLTTENVSDKTLRSRPMTLQQVDETGNFWFFVGREGPVFEDIRQKRQVNLAFANPNSNDYVSIAGEAEIVEDHAKVEELWSPLLTAWFPLGKDDPAISLVKVIPKSADFWETPGSKISQMVGLAKSVVSGQRADESVGEHKHIECSH